MVFKEARPALLVLVLSLVFTSCKSSQPPAPGAASNALTYPARPSVAPPAVKLFHQDNDTLTLTTKSDATDAEISAILWEFRDAARDRSFDALRLPQKFIDARKPVVWFHVYRGAKCASEKYTKGPLPCAASYHGAGDFTLGDYKNPQWDEGVLRHADDTETRLWDPDVPYTERPSGAPRPGEQFVTTKGGYDERTPRPDRTHPRSQAPA